MHVVQYRAKCFREKGEQCTICGTGDDVVVHHKDGDRSNNELENLIPLCERHHNLVHGYKDAGGEIEELRQALGDTQPSRTIELSSYRYTCPKGHYSVKPRATHFHCDSCYASGSGKVAEVVDQKTGEIIPRKKITVESKT